MDQKKLNHDNKDRMGQPSHRSEADDRGGQVENPERSDDIMPTPSFDEGERRPAPIEGTANDGVRNAVPGSPAGKKGRNESDEAKHTEATMPPGEGQDPKRNTM